MQLGDFAFYAGILGITMYLCLMVIQNTSRSGKVTEHIKKYDAAIAALQQQLQELDQVRGERQPGVDELIARVVELRGQRDRLQVQYEELQDRAQDRQINIQTKQRGD